MKTIAVFAALVAVALAAPQQYQQQQQFLQPQQQHHQQQHTPEVVLLKEVLHNNIGLNGYQYSYEQSDGQKREEVSQIENVGTDAKTNEPIAVNRVRGSYSFVNPYDGVTYTVTYVADENGYRAEGAHLPKSVV